MSLININYGINFIIDCNFQKLNKIIKILNTKLIAYSINNEIDNYINVYVKDDESGIELSYNDRLFDKIDEIIKIANIVPKLYVNNLINNGYESKLSKIEQIKSLEKEKIFKKYDKIINKKFNVLNGINSIYEWYTGAVFFKDYEWMEIDDNNKLKKLFNKSDNNSFLYLLPMDTGIILRSYKIYYYFSTHVSRFEKPNKIQIEKWFQNVITFLNDLNYAMEGYKIYSNYDRRLLLGVIDNLRNIILLMANTEMMILSDNGNDFLYHESFENRAINNYFGLINDYQKIIHCICFGKIKDNNSLVTIKKIVATLKRAIPETFENLKNITDSFVLGKCFNPLREIDNYIENYIVCEHIVNKIHLKNQSFNLIGVLYGGLELPFIMKHICSSDINISFLFQNHGMYLDRQQKNIEIIDSNIKEFGKINKNLTTFIIDDNMMSGKTMQFAFNKLFVNEYKINGIFVIRHPNLNRIAQLENFDIAMNLDLIDKFVYGMITDTPYTKIKRNTNFNNMFVNELNIFSIMTEVFLKALYCNNSFIKDSQVDIFAGYSEGQNDKI